MINFRVKETAFILFHGDCGLGTGETAGHTAAAILFHLSCCKHSKKTSVIIKGFHLNVFEIYLQIYL